MITKLQVLSEAIARFEGFFVTQEEARARGIAYPTIPQRLNNPGDLLYVGQPGATGEAIIGRDEKVRHYARFATLDAGWTALVRQIQLDAARGLTLWAFIQKYAPAADANDPKSYFGFVARKLQASPHDLLSAVILEAA